MIPSFIVWRQGETIQIKPQLLWHGQVFEIKFAGRELPPWLISEDDDPPPMRWIETSIDYPELLAGPGGRNPDRAHSYRLSKPKRRAFSASQP